MGLAAFVHLSKDSRLNITMANSNALSGFCSHVVLCWHPSSLIEDLVVIFSGSYRQLLMPLVGIANVALRETLPKLGFRILKRQVEEVLLYIEDIGAEHSQSA